MALIEFESPFPITRVLMFVLLPLTLFIMGWWFYRTYKLIVCKCQVCSKRIAGQRGKRIILVYMPWRKPLLTHKGCQKKK